MPPAIVRCEYARENFEPQALAAGWRATPQLRGRLGVHGPYLDPLEPAAGEELGCGSATTCWRRFDEWAQDARNG
jgi:hypothetical protein